MVVGAGETAELTLHYLVNKGVRNVVVANRTISHAEKLAHLIGGEAITITDFPTALSFGRYSHLLHFQPSTDYNFSYCFPIIRQQSS